MYDLQLGGEGETQVRRRSRDKTKYWFVRKNGPVLGPGEAVHPERSKTEDTEKGGIARREEGGD